jgi:hypothetical protein
MKYRLGNREEALAASAYLSKLSLSDSVVEVKRVNKNRTLSQNAFLHLLIGAFGAHFGYTMEEAKQIYKEINQDMYKYKKKDRVFWRSSADLNTEEMSKSIDRFRQTSEEHGCPLPEAEDKEWIMRLENDISKVYKYL